MLPGVAAPGIVAGLPRTGDGVEPPELLAGRGGVRRDVSASAEVAAGNTGDDAPVGHQRRGRHRVIVMPIGDLGIHTTAPFAALSASR